MAADLNLRLAVTSGSPTYGGDDLGVDAYIEDLDGKPRCPLPTTTTMKVLDATEAVTLQASAGMTLQVLQSGSGAGGTGTGGDTHSLTDAGKAWTADQWRGACIRITAGTGSGQERRIKTNTATKLTIDEDQIVAGTPAGAWVAPDATSVYQIHRSTYHADWPGSATPQDVVVVVATTGPKKSEKLFLTLEAVGT